MFDISEIYLLSKEKANEVYNEIKSGKLSFDSAASMYTQRPGFRDKKGRFGFVNSSNKLAKYAEDNKMKIGEFSEVFSLDVGFVIIQLNNIDPERKNTFEEALPKISNIVQDEITK